MSRASDISDTAAEWLIRLEGQASPEIWSAFATWMDEDPRHRAAFIRLRVAWNRVDRLKTLRPLDGAIDADLLARERVTPALIMSGGEQPLRGKQRRRLEDLGMPERRRVLATAAAIAAAGVLAWFGAYHFGWRSYATDVGGRERIELADGSTVDLNTNTELSARISNSRREVMLSKGEALFHVAHESKRPFYVVAGGTVVRAVGTAFSVRIRDHEHVEVLVAEGRVAVAPPDVDANFENPSVLDKAAKVSAGEAATLHRNSPVLVRALAPPDMTRKLAWIAGRLAFQGEKLEDAVQEFNRYNQAQIMIADPAILNVQVGGNFSTTDPQSFTAALQRLYGIRAQIDDDKGNIRLFSAGKPP